MSFTDNPVKDCDDYCDMQEKMLARLPVCECCGEPIQQEKAIYYNDQWICEGCEQYFYEEVIRNDYLVKVETEDGDNADS